MRVDEPLVAGYECLAGGGEMGRLMRSYDWARSSLGPVEQWSQSLRSALSICLNSRFPIAIYWGADCLLLYNDAWRPIVGDKHPWSLGRPGREVWSEIWDVVGPEAASVLATGEGIFHNDEILFMHRFGYTEECYFDYTFNPIQGAAGVVDGVLNIVSETTYRVLNDRRTRLLREVASQTGIAKKPDEACTLIVQMLRSDPADIPFGMIYLIDPDNKIAHLCSHTAADVDAAIAPAVIDLTTQDDPWAIAQVVHTRQAQVLTDLTTRFGVLPGSPWAEPPEEAVVLPIAGAGQGKVMGVLVAVASPRRRLDENYHDFFSQVAGQIGTAITNARSYEEERQRAEQLAELDRAKTVFFSNVSHEFRTPLTLMLAPAEDALQEAQDPVQRDRLDLIHRNALRLQKLVNTLLDFSRIEAGRIEAVYEPTDLAAFTTDLTGVFRSAIEQAGLQLQVDCPPLPEPVYIDRDMWEKIVLNLLSNAFKFTFEGTIRVSVGVAAPECEGVKEGESLAHPSTHLPAHSPAPAYAILEVQDTGIGIPAAELPHVFERFRRVKGARGRSYEGSGIGLSLVQELVKLHGGTVTVSSQAGQGTCFTVRLPLGTAHLPPERIAATRSLTSTATGTTAYVEEAQRWLPGTGTRDLVPSVTDEVFASLMERPKADHHQTQRIILADDNADMREYIKRLLSQSYEVIPVANGREALARIQQQPPDLVLSDVMMPEMDGFELLRSLRSQPQTQAIPVILLSARAGEEASVEGLAAGADDYLTKPFSARELMARVEAALKLAQLRQAAMQQEQSLRQEAETAKQRIETILSSVNDGFYTLDHDWRYTYVSDRHCAIIGMSREAVLGRSLWELFPEAVDGVVDVQFQQALREQTPLHFEYFHAPWSRWYEHRVYPSETGLAVFVTDMTERKRSELMLVEQKQLLERIASGQPLEDCLVALCSAIARLNPGTRACLLLADETRQSFPRSVTSELPASFGAGLKDAPINNLCIGTCGEAVYRGEPVACADIATDQRWSEMWRDLCLAHGIRACHSTPLMSIDNLPLGSLMLCCATARTPTDWEQQLAVVGTQIASIVFERDRSLSALQASEAHSRSILESINDGFFALDENWQFSYVNQAAVDLLGYTLADLAGKTIWEVYPGLIGSQFEQVYRQAMGDRVAGSLTEFYPDHDRWYEVRAYPATKGITVYFRNVSDRVQLETERDQLFRQEQAAREVAERANRVKDEFLAVLSHELRSPLNPILGWAKLLQSKKLDATKTQQAIDTIERNAKLQAELIEDLLDVSRILQGKLSLNVDVVNLILTIQGAIETVRLAAEAKAITIDTHLAPNLGQVAGDATRLQQVIWNLLSNAVKFTPNGGRVTVELSLVTGHASFVDRQMPNDKECITNYAQITVSDTGKGIRPEFLPHVFDYFRQEDGATTRKFGGLGLGLAIVRHLVELHGGTVQANSAGEDRGATFTITLPLIPLQSARSSDQSRAESPLSLHGRQILVIDDEADSREFVTFVLEEAGATVITASTAHEGLLAFTQARPDVLLSDIGMPEMDGYMLMQQVRALSPEMGGTVLAIALTAYAGEINYQQAMAAGFQKHIAKPVDPGELVTAIASLLNSNSASR